MPGGPKLRYMDHIRRILNKPNIPISDLEKLATDRDTWRSAYACGLSTLCQVSDQAAADRRSRRHHRRNPTATDPRCPQCSRVCASEFGLRSHLRSHISRLSQRRTTTSKHKANLQRHFVFRIKLNIKSSINRKFGIMLSRICPLLPRHIRDLPDPVIEICLKCTSRISCCCTTVIRRYSVREGRGGACLLKSATPSIPRERDPTELQFLVFSHIYEHTV